jgi:23S rRNA (uridine2552-2'-O)-methyltransferase
MADYKKPDYWQQKAHEEGYPARSVYKLKEIDEKFNFFKAVHPISSRLSGQTAFKVLDLGAAPGSWSLYVLRKMAAMKKGTLVSVDLSPLSREFDKGLFDSGNFFFIKGDITAAQTHETILAKGPYSAIISDAAPATTGNHTVDAARSLALAEEAANYAENALASGGSLVVKIFQGGDSAALLKRIKTLFETAKSFKPQACRGESVETYFIGFGKR